VQIYWRLGERIFVEEQRGQDRADYGKYIIKNSAANLEAEFGSGFSVRQLELARQFYRVYPIANELRPQLNWSQYRLLIRVDDDFKREYYELESANHAWTGRETGERSRSGAQRAYTRIADRDNQRPDGA
jgi:hypothetical protein